MASFIGMVVRKTFRKYKLTTRAGWADSKNKVAKSVMKGLGIPAGAQATWWAENHDVVFAVLRKHRNTVVLELRKGFPKGSFTSADLSRNMPAAEFAKYIKVVTGALSLNPSLPLVDTASLSDEVFARTVGHYALKDEWSMAHEGKGPSKKFSEAFKELYNRNFDVVEKERSVEAEAATREKDTQALNASLTKVVMERTVESSDEEAPQTAVQKPRPAPAPRHST